MTAVSPNRIFNTSALKKNCRRELFEQLSASKRPLAPPFAFLADDMLNKGEPLPYEEDDEALGIQEMRLTDNKDPVLAGSAV